MTTPKSNHACTSGAEVRVLYLSRAPFTDQQKPGSSRAALFFSLSALGELWAARVLAL